MQGACKPLKSVKAIKFSYEPSEDIRSVLESFREMCDDSIHIALTEKPRSRFDLIGLSYQRLKAYSMACVVPQARPSKWSGEGEPRRQETAGNPGADGWS